MKLATFFFACLFVCCAGAQTVPDFTMTDIDEKQWNLYDELGKGNVVLLDFFFVDCVPCQTLTPMVEQLYQDYGAGTGKVLVLGISDRDNNQRIKQFEQQYGSTYPAAGTEGGGDTITALYQSWFPFVGWPVYAVVCADTTIAWNLPKNNGLPEIRDTIDHCLQKTTGIERAAKKVHKVSVYPNPASQQLFIQNIHSSEVLVTITDLNGKELFVNFFSGADAGIKFELPSLKSGIYLLRLKSENETIIKKLIIHNK